MKKEKKRLGFVLVLILMISLFSIISIAQDENGDVVDEAVSEVVDEVVEEKVDVVDESVDEVVDEAVEIVDEAAEIVDEVVDAEDLDEDVEQDEPEEEYEERDVEEVLQELEEEYEDEGEEITDEGITPDSNFYFIDEFFDRFGDKIENKEEKIAEIRAMVEKGDFEAAERALERYREYAEELERELDPERREEARRSAVDVYNTLQEIEEELPEDEKEEYYDDIIETETNIVKSVEISSKIKDLCMQLSELDPMEYSRVCGMDGDAPKWKKKLDKKLTKEQKKEAKEFGKILTSCFKTSGKECRCEDISFYDFSVFCEKMSSLAVECEIEQDEDACMEMEDAGQDMPELPEHLEGVFYSIEKEFAEAQYGMHMPEECARVDASPKECALIMTETHAPFECRDAIKEAIKSGRIKGEKGAREICDKIMFEKDAPQECVEAGITDPEECGKLMMPPECIEKDLSARECKKFMDSKRDEFGGPSEMGFGQECMRIENPDERLRCFEDAVGGMGEHYGTKPKFREGEGELTWQCKEHRIHWPPDCETFMREEWPEIERREREDRERRDEEERRWRDEGDWDDDGGWDEGDDYPPPEEGPGPEPPDGEEGDEGEGPGEEGEGGAEGEGGEGTAPPGEEGGEGGEGGSESPEGEGGGGGTSEGGEGSEGGGTGEGGDTGTSPEAGSGGGSSEGGGDTGGDSGGSGDSGGGDTGGGDTGGGDNTGGGITGEVIFDNKFLDYWFS